MEPLLHNNAKLYGLQWVVDELLGPDIGYCVFIEAERGPDIDVVFYNPDDEIAFRLKYPCVADELYKIWEKGKG